MSLVGFRAQNHPQQATKPDVDDRAITDADFAVFNERFGFTIDAAAASHNAKLPRFWTLDDDALAQSWAGERVWCNPPYSNIRPWVEKAWGEWTARYAGCPVAGVSGGCTGCRYCEQAKMRADLMSIVLLLPANRTEQGWWQQLVEPAHRLRRPDFCVEFLPGRMRFLARGQREIGPNERPPFGCCLLIWEHS